MKTLLAIDLSSIFWQNWHATAEAPVGEAIQRSVSHVTRLADGFDRAVVCVDTPPYKRKELHPDYKANREKQPALASEQLRQVIDRLKLDGFPIVGHEGAEADDVIASIVKSAGAYWETTIATADKDLAQLLSPLVAIKSIRTGERMTAIECEAKFGVPPSKVRDWIALVGDSSDNIPGIKGIGPIHAAKLLKEWENVDVLLRNVDKIQPERFREPIMAAGDQIRLALQLVTLDASIPIDWTIIDRDRVTQPRTEPATDGAWHSEEEPAASDGMAAQLAAVGASQVTESGSVGEQTAGPHVGRQPSLPADSAIPAGSGGPIAHTGTIEEGDRYSRSIMRVPVDFSLQLEPSNMNGVVQLSRALFESRLYQRYPNADAILAVILRGRELGLPALLSLDLFHVVKGRPTMHAHLITGLCLRSPLCEYFDCIETTDTIARYETKRRGRPAKIEKFDIDDAIRMGVLKRMPDGTLRQPTESGAPGQWDKDPRNMLRVRCSTRLARMVYPDIVGGLYSPEEFEEAAA